MVAEHWALLRMIAIAMFLGVTLIQAVAPQGRIALAAVLGLSFPVGMAVVGFTCLFLGMVHVPLALSEITTALAFVQTVLLAAWILRRGKQENAHLKELSSPGGSHSLNAWQKWMFGALSLYLIYQFYFIVGVTFIFPIQVYDAVTATALKSKVFFYDGSIDALKFLILKSYPLMVPFELFWTALNIGRWDDTLVNVVFPLTYLGFSVFQYMFVREKYGKLWALGCVALTTSSAFYTYHAAIPYQDFALMVFNAGAQMLMVMSYRRQSLELLPLAGLCAGLVLWTKLDGVAYFAINALLCLYILKEIPGAGWREKASSFLQFLLPGALIYAFYQWFVVSQGFIQAEGRFHLKGELHILERLGPMLQDYMNVLFLYNDWTVLWAVLIAGLLAGGRAVLKNFEITFYLTVIAVTIAMFVTVDLLTQNYISHHSVLSRVFLHFYPVVPMLILAVHHDIFRRKTD